MAPIDPKKWNTNHWDTGLTIHDDEYWMNAFDKTFDKVDKAFDKVDEGFNRIDKIFDRVDHWEVPRLKKKVKKHKKHFRRFMMSSKGGIGIGGLIFWAFIGYQIFGGDDDADKSEGTAEKQDFQTKVVETAKKVKTELDGVVSKAKEEYNRDRTSEDAEKEYNYDATDNKKTENPDDIYGSNDDKW